MTTRDNCPSEERLTAYLLRELSGKEAEAVRMHLEACEECRTAMEDLEPTVNLLRELFSNTGEQPVELDQERRAAVLKAAGVKEDSMGTAVRFRSLIGLAAVLVVGLGLGVYLQRDSSSSVTVSSLEKKAAEDVSSARPAPGAVFEVAAQLETPAEELSEAEETWKLHSSEAKAVAVLGAPMSEALVEQAPSVEPADMELGRALASKGERLEAPMKDQDAAGGGGAFAGSEAGLLSFAMAPPERRSGSLKYDNIAPAPASAPVPMMAAHAPPLNPQDPAAKLKQQLFAGELPVISSEEGEALVACYVGARRQTMVARKRKAPAVDSFSQKEEMLSVEELAVRFSRWLQQEEKDRVEIQVLYRAASRTLLRDRDNTALRELHQVIGRALQNVHSTSSE